MASLSVPTFPRASACRLRPPPRRRAGIAALAAVIGLTWAMPAPAQKAADTFQTAAPFAILIDADSDTVLFEKNADQPMFPASMSKLMTMEVVFHELTEGRLSLDTEF